MLLQNYGKKMENVNYNEIDIREELIEKAKEAGLKVTPEQAEKFNIYLKLLLEWNEKINLTAITDPHEAVIKHFVDSISFIKSHNIKPGAKVTIATTFDSVTATTTNGVAEIIEKLGSGASGTEVIVKF